MQSIYRATTPRLQFLRSTHHCRVSSTVLISYLMRIVLVGARSVTPSLHCVRAMAEEWFPFIPLSPPLTKCAHVMTGRATWVRLFSKFCDLVCSAVIDKPYRHNKNEVSLARAMNCVRIRSLVWLGLVPPSGSLHPTPLRVLRAPFSGHALTPFEFTLSLSGCIIATPHHLRSCLRQVTPLALTRGFGPGRCHY